MNYDGEEQQASVYLRVCGRGRDDNNVDAD